MQMSLIPLLLTQRGIEDELQAVSISKDSGVNVVTVFNSIDDID